MARIEIGDRSLSYDVAGDGPALVLLHAFPFDHRFWRPTVERLSPRMKVVTPDLRGFGTSERGTPGYGIADMADDVARLLDLLRLPTATVAGLSMGGYVALAFADRHPGRLARLVLCDTKAGPDSPEARKGRDEAIALVRAQGVGAYADRQMSRLLAPGATPAVIAEVRALMEQPVEGVVAGLEALRDRPDRREELGRIACPTLVVVGREDALTPPSEAEALAQAIPGAQRIELPGAGHLPNLETPDAFAEALARFLAD